MRTVDRAMQDDHIGEVVARREGVSGTAQDIARLSGSDRSSVLMHAMSLAAESVRPVDLLARHTDDRFVRPATSDFRRVRRVADGLLNGLGSEVELLTLAPMVPFATHHALGATPQNNVVTTVRGTEVAADPTAGLALEASVRRRALLADDPKSRERVDLGTIQRVTRGQPFDEPMAFAHFDLVARVTAGRDEGNGDFEVSTTVAHLEGWLRGLAACGVVDSRVTLTDFSGRHGRALDRIAERTGASTDPGRARGRGYYDTVCFQIDIISDEGRVDVADGGMVPWAGKLLGSSKERMLISAVGVERVTHVAAAGGDSRGE
jgi:hypothetical protein